MPGRPTACSRNRSCRTDWSTGDPSTATSERPIRPGSSCGRRTWALTSPPGCTDPSEAGVASTGDGYDGRPGWDGDVGPVCRRRQLDDVRIERGHRRDPVVVHRRDRTRTLSSGIRRLCSATVSISVSLRSVTVPLWIQGQLLQLNRVTGALQNTFDVVPNGCTGGGVWGSPTLDAAAGTIYFDTGTPPRRLPQHPRRAVSLRGARF